MRTLLALAAMLTLVACAPAEKKLVAAEDLNKKSLQPLVGERLDFSLMTGGTSASWGLFGPIFGNIAAASSAASNGAALMREHNIPDQIVLVSKNLSERLKKKYEMTLKEPVTLQTTDEALIAQMYKDTDYTLYIYGRSGTNHNLAGSLGLYTYMIMELKEVATGTKLAVSVCNDRTDHKWGLDELRDNKAKKLKEEMVKAGERCEEQFAKDLGI